MHLEAVKNTQGIQPNHVSGQDGRARQKPSHFRIQCASLKILNFVSLRFSGAVLKTIRDPSQRELFDPFEGLIGAAGRKIIAEGWQSIFREVLFERMPVEEIGKDLSDDSGRSSFELYAIIGLLLNWEFQGWTVLQAHKALVFCTNTLYALNFQPGADSTQRTIERYLARLQKDETITEVIFSSSNVTLLHSMEVRMKRQRLDLTCVLSDMSNIGRARIIGLALKHFFAKI